MNFGFFARLKAMQWRRHFEVVATLLIIAICISILWRLSHQPVAQPVQARAAAPVRAPRTEPPPPAEPVSIAGAAIKGNRAAKLAIIEHSEYQCPFCAAFVRDTLPAIDKAYLSTGKVQLAFRNFPLEQHKFAQKAAEAAECAGRQGQFWAMHDSLFAAPKTLDESSLRERATTLRLDRTQFDVCLSGVTGDKVRQDVEHARPLGVGSTPTFFIGTVQPDGRVKVAERVTGAVPFERFQKVLDKLLDTIGTAQK